MIEIEKSVKFSIIIPIYNEEKNIPSLLANLSQLEGDFELIFVDGGSQDQTVDLLREFIRDDSQADTENESMVDHSPQNIKRGQESSDSGSAGGLDKLASVSKLILGLVPGRGQQLNLGTREARGDFLVFLHADSELSPEALADLEDVLEGSRGKYQAACWRLAFDSRHPFVYLIGVFASLRVIFRQIAFGDQGLMLRREIFEELGGFPDQALMEDYEFSMRLKAKGYKIGLGQEKIRTSARRFEEGGPLRTLILMQRLQAMYRSGVDIEEIRAIYNSKKITRRKFF